MSEALRLFIALEIPPDVLDVITALQDDLKRLVPARAARWTRMEGIHLTLKFLGDTPPGQLESINEALRKAAVGHHPLDLAAQGLGCFPDARRPRVLWLGLAGDLPRLRMLAESVESHIAPLGFPPEERGFNPHLTLARTSREASRQEIAGLADLVSNHDAGQIAAWRAESISLMKSELRPDGARYTRMTHVQLE